MINDRLREDLKNLIAAIVCHRLLQVGFIIFCSATLIALTMTRFNKNYNQTKNQFLFLVV
jgi:hypothetical protein